MPWSSGPFVMQGAVTTADPAFALYAINYLNLKRACYFFISQIYRPSLTPSSTGRGLFLNPSPSYGLSCLKPAISRMNAGRHTLSSWLPHQSATCPVNVLLRSGTWSISVTVLSFQDPNTPYGPFSDTLRLPGYIWFYHHVCGFIQREAFSLLLCHVSLMLHKYLARRWMRLG